VLRPQHPAMSRSPLGRRIFEGIGVSALAPRITYAVSGRNEPSLGAPDVFECHVTELEYGADGVPRLGAGRVIYRAESGSNLAPEPQDFRRRGGRDDSEVIMAEYVRNRQGRPDLPHCVVKGVALETGEVRTYVYEGGVHNECEGIFPDLKFGVFLWPKKANQQHTVLAGSSAVTKACKDPDATWEFVKWWNTPENQVGWYDNAGGNAPSRKSVYAKPPFSYDPIWKPLLQFVTVGNSPPRPMAERYTELNASSEVMRPG